MTTDPRRHVPKVDRVVDALEGLPHPLLVACAREAVDAARERAAAGESVGEAAVVADAEARDAHQQADIMTRYRDSLLVQISRLQHEQDDLLDRMAADLAES